MEKELTSRQPPGCHPQAVRLIHGLTAVADTAGETVDHPGHAGLGGDGWNRTSSSVLGTAHACGPPPDVRPRPAI